MRSLNHNRVSACIAFCVTLCLCSAAAAEDTRYGFFSAVEGSATLFVGDGERTAVELNQPVLSGDHVWISPGSRLEVILADGCVSRLDEDTEVVFQQLALSADLFAPSTQLRLLVGEIQLVVPDDYPVEELPRVDTPNTTLYVQQPGSYRIATAAGWTEVVVRDGFAELLTERGSSVVRQGERVLAEGESWPRVTLARAPGEDSLENWGHAIDRGAAAADLEYVDSDLRYAAAPLARHGGWLEIDGHYGWRPRVELGWSPYSLGRWIHTPLGLTWVSYEPWGWVPYHYGAWDYYDPYGWVWFPGRAFAPAWVYWYWGPTYVGWCPTGFYHRYYRHRSFASFHFGDGPFGFGVHGWAGGHIGHFRHWTFVDHGHVGHRRLALYTRSGAQLDRGGVRDIGRGIVTTDTRPVTPARWTRPDEVQRALEHEGRRPGGGRTEALPDVTPFVARSRDLPERVARAALPVTTAGETASSTRRSGSAQPIRSGPTPTADWRAGEPRPTDRTEGADRGQASGRTASPSRSASASAQRPGSRTATPPRAPSSRNEARPQRPDVRAPASGATRSPAVRPSSGGEPWRSGNATPRVGISSPGRASSAAARSPATDTSRPQAERRPSPSASPRSSERSRSPGNEAWRSNPSGSRSRAGVTNSLGRGTSRSPRDVPVVRRIVEGVRSSASRSRAAGPTSRSAPSPARPDAARAAPRVAPPPSGSGSSPRRSPGARSSTPSKPPAVRPSPRSSPSSRPSAVRPSSRSTSSRPSAGAPRSVRSGASSRARSASSGASRPPSASRPSGGSSRSAKSVPSRSSRSGSKGSAQRSRPRRPG